MKKVIFLFYLFVCSISLSHAQEKYEKEFRIKENEVPQTAKDFVQSIGFNSKIRWYKEESLTGETVEAKTRHTGLKYSIEFNLEGEIEDVECIIEWEKIPIQTRTKISEYLEKEHEKTKLKKIQIQFTGIDQNLINQVREGVSTSIIKYEIELKAKTDNKREMLEYLFSEGGEMEQKSTIVFKNTDNLEF